MKATPTSDRPVLVDLTRLVARQTRGAPTGIDRVDLAYARHYLRGARPGIAWTPWGARLMPPARVRELQAGLEESWRSGDDSPVPDGPGYERLRDWLTGPPTPPSAAPAGIPGAKHRRSRLTGYSNRLGKAARTRSWQAANEAPADAFYIHTSHLGLENPETLAWLDDRPDIAPIFFIHDTIPIDFPEYSKPAESERHRRRMTNVAQRAAGILVNSEDVAERLGSYLRRANLREVPITAAPLGIESAFGATPDSAPSSRPYFVLLGTIEARKNHLLILQVWRALARELGPDTPALVVIGQRGWEAESAIDLLDRCETIAPHVIEASGLPTPVLASVLAGARALLMPSFAEGFGIPIVEALALGTPVIASDIAVHREVAGSLATFIDTLDGPGWAREIRSRSAEPQRRPLAHDFETPTWTEHFRSADTFLASL